MINGKGKKSNKVKKNKQILQYGGDIRYSFYDDDYNDRHITLVINPNYNRVEFEVIITYSLNEPRIENLIDSLNEVRQSNIGKNEFSDISTFKKIIEELINGLHQKYNESFYVEYSQLENIKGKISLMGSPPPPPPPPPVRRNITLFEKIMSFNNSFTKYIIIDMDLVLTELMYMLCKDDSILISKSECIKKRIYSKLSKKNMESRETFISTCFKDDQYQKFLDLLINLKRIKKNVLLTSTKLPRTILKAFLSIDRNVMADILKQLLGENDLNNILNTTNGEIDRRKCGQYAFLDNYIIASEYDSYKPLIPTDINSKRTFNNVILQKIVSLLSNDVSFLNDPTFQELKNRLNILFITNNEAYNGNENLRDKINQDDIIITLIPIKRESL